MKTHIQTKRLDEYVSGEDMVNMTAVARAPHNGQIIEVPWQIANKRWPEFLTIDKDTTSDEIGLIVHAFTRQAFSDEYPKFPNPTEIEVIFNKIIQRNRLILSGGISVSDNNRTIYPGCCCGVEDWRQWKDFLEEGTLFWMGHSPTPSIEEFDDKFRIWSGSYEDNEIPPNYQQFFIDISIEDFSNCLMKVNQDLINFLISLEYWMDERFPKYSRRLVEKVKFSLHIFDM